MAFDNFCTKAVLSASPGQTPKKVWTATFLGRTWTNHKLFESSRSRKLNHAVSAWLAKKRKLQLFFARKPRKISFDWASWCASRGINNFSFGLALSETRRRALVATLGADTFSTSSGIGLSRADDRTSAWRCDIGRLFLRMVRWHIRIVRVTLVL